MKFLCIEDHPLILLGLKMVFAEFYPQAVVGHAETFPAAVAILEQERFDLAILDIDIPGGENVRMMKMLLRIMPGSIAKAKANSIAVSTQRIINVRQIAFV